MAAEEIAVTVKKKRVRHCYLRIRPTGEVFLTVPVGMKEARIQGILEQKQEWIRARLAEVAGKTRQTSAYLFDTGETLFLFGQPVTLRVETARGRSRADLQGDTLVLSLPEGAVQDPEARKEVLRRFYRTQMQNRLTDRLPFWEERVGKKAARIQLRWMKSRWGSCTLKTGRISLNLQLAWYPPECLDGVIVHELTHLWVRGHQADFWERMDAVFPARREVQKLRKEFPRCPLL